MNLVRLKLRHYKRFFGDCDLSVDGKVVALVGPNEAGKSSVLDAITHLHHSKALRAVGAAQEVTRNIPTDAKPTQIEGLYHLDAADHTALRDITASKIRWCHLIKKVDGTRTFEFIPKATRALGIRKSVSEELARLLTLATAASKASWTSSVPAPAIEGVIQSLTSTAETLTSGALSGIASLATSLKDVPQESLGFDGPALRELLTLLQEAEAKSPHDCVVSALAERLPRALLFSDAERLLAPAHDISAFFRDKDRAQVPPSLRNLARCAGLDLEMLHQAKSDPGRTETLLDKANNALTAFLEGWTQSIVSVRLKLDGNVLHILVSEKAGDFVALNQRSDGLRQFLALICFVHREHDGKLNPILLIDEVERHLHYDAQADLIQILAEQTIAQKVIYTTHSIGALPEDLGLGVRLVQPTGVNSTFENSFWDSPRKGFSPLLFGMGATALAFIPIRHALITEGPSDKILLPAMLREVEGSTTIGFQIAPGLSESGGEALIALEREAPSTVFLTDADAGGREIRKKLVRAGVSEDRIFELPSANGARAVIEDFLDPESYAAALNAEFDRSGGKAHIQATELGATNRPGVVKQWCEIHGVAFPNKTAVGYRLLESRLDRKLVSDEACHDLANLLASIHKKLNLKSSGATRY